MLERFFHRPPDSFLYTNPGGREVNEDTGLLLANKSGGFLAVVADGLGGHGGGALASKAAAEVLSSGFQKEKALSPEKLPLWFAEANERVLSMQTAECEMKTTLVALWIAGNKAVWAHIGDSRLYHFTDGELTERTIDHSVSQMAVLSGEITEDQIRGHVDRNRLLRAIGRPGEVKLDVSPVTELKGKSHAFLLCSDGFWEYVWEREMTETLRVSGNAKEWTMKMVEILRGRAKPGNDNHTAAVVWIDG